jgi:hypothetical protein
VARANHDDIVRSLHYHNLLILDRNTTVAGPFPPRTGLRDRLVLG